VPVVILSAAKDPLAGTYMLADPSASPQDDLPLATLRIRLWRRTTHRITTREELWNGNRESWLRAPAVAWRSQAVVGAAARDRDRRRHAPYFGELNPQCLH
jgi:hypothetical protein